ncbi:unnamed protein product [Prunus armeniaca]|uniref:Uncharacterized protein n=1 Tax=Prunus armeniaca TaxID=36596 RepID=A0A6J5VCW9_PRUAR|nr:unnamed protein product [Prunus armeniaca]
MSFIIFAEDYRDRVMWTWKCPASDAELVIDGMDRIKFQAHSVNYPPILIEQPEDSKPFAPTVVTVSSCVKPYYRSIDFDGLDPVLWWDDAEDKDEEPEDP